MLGIPAGFFLLPPPTPVQRSGRLRASGKHSVLVDLLAAPVLEYSLVAELSNRYESRSRRVLAGRIGEIRRIHCKLPAARAQRRLRHWFRKLEEDHQAWQAADARHQRALIHRLSRRFRGTRLRNLLEMEKLARSLGTERTSIIRRTWEAEFRRLERRRCAGARARLHLPSEALYEPYYLALFQFYGSLPPGVRTDLVLRFRLGKSSDK